MTELQRAIIFLQEARSKIEEAACYEGNSETNLNLVDVADDIDNVLVALENMGIKL